MLLQYDNYCWQYSKSFQTSIQKSAFAMLWIIIICSFRYEPNKNMLQNDHICTYSLYDFNQNVVYEKGNDRNV